MFSQKQFKQFKFNNLCSTYFKDKNIITMNTTTCLVLPNGLYRSINVMFSFRQGDPMNLYTLQQAPFLRLLLG
jgi:hypothetical protein